MNGITRHGAVVVLVLHGAAIAMVGAVTARTIQEWLWIVVVIALSGAFLYAVISASERAVEQAVQGAEWDGVPERIFRVVMEVQQRERSLMWQKEQADAQRSLLLRQLSIGVMLIDPHGTVVLCNDKALRFLGCTYQEVQLRGVLAVQIPIDMAQLCRYCLNTGEMHRETLWLHPSEDRALYIELIPLPTVDQMSYEGTLVVVHDVTDMKRLERMRNEFVANVTHELKTPIAAIKGFTETLLSGALNNVGTAQQFLTIIQEEAERLNRLIGDILDLSKMETGRLEMQYSPVELRAFILRTVHMLEAQAQKRDIVFEIDLPDESYIEADEDRLRQILINLFANAIAYSQPQGVVRVSIAEAESDDVEGGMTIIRIADTGIGIPKEDLPRIFERFYRVDKARTRTSGGTGLGLSIVKHLVESHGGAIQIESEEGIGTTVTLELPNVQW